MMVKYKVKSNVALAILITFILCALFFCLT